MGRLRIAGIVLVLVASGCTTSWGTFRFGNNRAGYNPFESTIGVGNVDSLQLQTTFVTPGTTVEAATTSPDVVDGRLYVSNRDGHLYVFDATGATNCSDAPKRCLPVWRATTGDWPAEPLVADGHVYAAATGAVEVFDADGSTGCSGTPTSCKPLWTYPVDAHGTTSPAISGGTLYVTTGSRLYAFDATGSAGCSGTPKTCTPLWRAHDTDHGPPQAGPPSIAGGKVFVTSNDRTVKAFDAAGTTNCSGTPKLCTPLWQERADGPLGAVAAVSGGRVFTASTNVEFDEAVYAFDADDGSRLWRAETADDGSPAVANGVVYSTRLEEGGGDRLDATDAASGAHLWEGVAEDTNGGNGYGSPVVANGVVYLADGVALQAWDARGTTGCSGSPKTCEPLLAAIPPTPTSGTPPGIREDPTVVNGHVYVASGNNILAFGLAS